MFDWLYDNWSAFSNWSSGLGWTYPKTGQQLNQSLNKPTAMPGSISAYGAMSQDQLNANNSQLDATSMQAARNFAVASKYADSITKGANAYYSSVAQRRYYDSMADNYEYQARAALSNAANAREGIYNAYRHGEWEAMQQGLTDGARISSSVAQNASSGFAVGQGSKKQVTDSYKIQKDLNQYAIQQSTTSQANAARSSWANQYSSAVMAQGNAKAMRIMAHSTSPLLNVFTTMTGDAADHLLDIYGGKGSGTFNLTSVFSK